MKQTAQELFLNETLKMAGFDPEEDDFEILKEDMRPNLNEYLETHLAKKLSPEYQKEYSEAFTKPITRFIDKIENFDDVLAEIYLSWQEKYLQNFK